MTTPVFRKWVLLVICVFLCASSVYAQTPGKRYTDYDPIAHFYNRFWSVPLERLAMGKLQTILLPKLKAKAKILDLMCGTGHIAARLQSKGFEMTGLDGSAKMLAYAQKNAPGMKTMLEDARYFKTLQKFDAVICMSDGLNHIMDEKGLTQTFAQVYKALKKGGCFAFDMNWEERYIKGWNLRGLRFQFDNYEGIFTSSYKRSTRKGSIKFWMYYPIDQSKNTWTRKKWELTQYCYTPGQIKNALQKAGFQDIKTYEAAKDLGDQRNAGRAYYLCRK